MREETLILRFWLAAVGIWDGRIRRRIGGMIKVLCRPDDRQPSLLSSSFPRPGNRLTRPPVLITGGRVETAGLDMSAGPGSVEGHSTETDADI